MLKTGEQQGKGHLLGSNKDFAKVGGFLVKVANLLEIMLTFVT